VIGPTERAGNEGSVGPAGVGVGVAGAPSVSVLGGPAAPVAEAEAPVAQSSEMGNNAATTTMGNNAAQPAAMDTPAPVVRRAARADRG